MTVMQKQKLKLNSIPQTCLLNSKHIMIDVTKNMTSQRIFNINKIAKNANFVFSRPYIWDLQKLKP